MGNAIERLRRRAGLSQDELAERIGTTGAQVSRLEGGKRRLTWQWAERLAVGLGCQPIEVVGTGGAGALRVPDGFQAVEVVGVVEAGVYREAAEWPDDDRFQVIAPSDPWCHLPHFAYRVRGQAMDCRFPPGSIVVCVPPAALGRGPSIGDCLVVELYHGPLVEVTVREVAVVGSSFRLTYRSTKPSLNTKLDLPADALPWGPKLPDWQVRPDPTAAPAAGARIRVVGVVVASLRLEPGM